MKTIRSTTAQAIVRWLLAQRTGDRRRGVPVFAGVFGIFGHGNVTSLAEALEPVQDQLPTWRGRTSSRWRWPPSPTPRRCAAGGS